MGIRTSAPNATTGAPGLVQLAGNLGGSATAPTVTDLTIASQAQGDILYFNGTNWVSLAAGTSGNYLKTQGAGANPTWAAVAAGGDWSELDNVTLGADATTLASNTFTAKQFLRIHIWIAGFDANDNPCLQFNGDTGSNYGYANSENLAGFSQTNTQAKMILQGANANTVPNVWCIDIANPSATRKGCAWIGSMQTSAALAGNIYHGGGVWNNTAAQITSVTLLCASTAKLKSGTRMAVYGSKS